MTKTTKTAPLATRNRRSNAPDADTEAMIFQGCNITQLAKLFRMERRFRAGATRDSVVPAVFCGIY